MIPRRLYTYFLAAAVLCMAPTSSQAELIWHSALDGDATAITGADGIPTGVPTATPDAVGNIDGAVLFDGASFFDIGFLGPFSAGTISAWVRSDDNAGERGAVAAGASGGGASVYFSFMNQAAGVIRVDLDDGAARRDAQGGGAQVLGQWYHIATTFADDGTLRLYIDGAEVDTQALGGDVAPYTMSSAGLIGTERPGARFWVGAIDDVRIYDDELDFAAVGNLFAAGPLYDVETEDDDNDGLPDTFEQLIIDADPDDAINDIADVLPGDDFDNDLSSNEDELDNITNPTNPDTDDDGYLDGVETNDGSFDDIASDTGTNPRDADSDDDGLLDGVETNSGSFQNAGDTGSDPLDPDSDGDNFTDGAEVNDHMTDPNNPNSVPSFDIRVLFIGGNATGDQAADDEVIAFIENRYGAGSVTYLQANQSAAGDEVGFDLLVLSSTPGSGDKRNKFHNSTVPVVNWEEALTDNGGGEFGMSSEQMTKSQTATLIAMTGHPIGLGLPDEFALFDAAGPEVTGTGLLFAGLTSAGNAVDGTGSAGPGNGQDFAGRAMILTAEVGDPVDPGAGILDNIAPSRRVMLPWTDNTAASLTDDGWTLFGNALDWATGRLGEPEAMRITEIIYDDTSDPGNVIVTLTFTSELGQDYGIFTSTDFEEPILNRADIDDAVPGQDGTTTFVIDFNQSGLDPADPRRFFVVIESN